MSRGVLIGLAAGAALVLASPVSAGGSFEEIVAVGANGGSKTIHLRPTGPRSEAVLDGRAVPVPSAGFVRLYPMIGGLPADPGRYYPAPHVLCLYWSEPATNCIRLGAAGITLLSPFTTLPLRHQRPTTPVAVRYRSRLLRYANGNIFAALEMAVERKSVRRSSPPRHAVRLVARWIGPQATQMPSVVWLGPHGVYTPHRFSSLSRGPWCYLTLNLPNASASLIEATNRICG